MLRVRRQKAVDNNLTVPKPNIPPQQPQPVSNPNPPAPNPQAGPNNEQSSSNKKMVIFLVGGAVLILLLVGGFYYFMSSKTTSSPTTQARPTVSPSPQAESLEKEVEGVSIETLNSYFNEIDKDLQSL